jgi:hypothetical protein
MKESHRSLFHVFHPLADDAADVLVGQGIIESLAIPAEFDQLAAPQDPQLVGANTPGQGAFRELNTADFGSRNTFTVRITFRATGSISEIVVWNWLHTYICFLSGPNIG